MNTSIGGGLATASLALFAIAGCAQADKVFCSNGNCGWSETETTRLAGLADLPAAPPVDTTNKYFGTPMAEQLGRKFFWDTRFSGYSTGADSLKRPMPYAVALIGNTRWDSSWLILALTSRSSLSSAIGCSRLARSDISILLRHTTYRTGVVECSSIPPPLPPLHPSIYVVEFANSVWSDSSTGPA